MKRLYIYFFLVLLGSTLIASSQIVQTDSTALKGKFNNKKVSNSAGFMRSDSIFSFRSAKGYIPSLLGNFAEQASAPFRFNKKQWIITGVSIGITAALIHFDNHIDMWAKVQKQQHGWVNKSSPVITNFGSSYGITTVAAVGLVSAIFKNQKGVETSLLASQALITSGIWVQLIKHLTGREDPSASYIYSKMPGGQWWGPFAQYDQDLPIYKSVNSFDAFPSGHSAAAFSMATVFALQYRDTKVIPVICYSAATLVGISRLTEHAHWASDVFVGGLIGYACGKQVVDHHNKLYSKPTPGQKVKPEFSIIQNANQVGISVKW